MKVFLTFARKLKRPRVKKILPLRKLLRNERQSVNVSNTDAKRKPEVHNFRSEKLSNDAIPYNESMTNVSPPTYDECVGISTKKRPAFSYVQEPQEKSAPKLIAKATPRGRTTQILYRSQLNTLTQENSRRPSSPHKRDKVRRDPFDVDDRMVFRFHRSLGIWWQHLTGLCVAFMIAMLCVTTLLIYGY